LKESENDWRMRDVTFVGKDWHNPWTGKMVPEGTQITVVSIIPLSKKKQLTIAVPNATALCLNISKRSWQEAKEIRKASKIDAISKSKPSFNSHSDSFDYIEKVMESVVMAYTSLEAFANEIIPDDYEYACNRKSKVILEIMDKKEIERWKSLDEKLKTIIPEVLEITSPAGTACWQGYVNLKRIRDRIIHMKNEDRKSSGIDTPTLWHDLFKIRSPFIQAKDIIDFYVKHHYCPDVKSNKFNWLRISSSGIVFLQSVRA